MADTSKKIISLPVRDFFALSLFLISLGISIGGLVKIINDINTIEGKIEKISDKLEQIKSDNAELKGIISGLKK